ncbi:hypothetical protein EE612_053328, partial [Oryza sativa]
YFIFTGHMEGITLRHMVSCSWASLPSFLVFMRLELLTIPREGHQDTPLHLFQIINLPLSHQGTVTIEHGQKNLNLQSGCRNQMSSYFITTKLLTSK